MTGLTAWVFPGQGAQEPGMGRDAFDVSPAARQCFADAGAGSRTVETFEILHFAAWTPPAFPAA